jgi:hypothetical protein
VQQFTDLVRDRGVRAAWARTCVDLIVTVPRYRLERVMNEQHSLITVNIGITLLALGGVVGWVTDLYPGMVLFVAAVALGVAQRSTLSQAIRTPDSTAAAGGCSRRPSSLGSSWSRTSRMTRLPGRTESGRSR